MKYNKKRLSILLCAVLALMITVGGAVGGTVAWLVDNSDTITNTFTTSNIEVTLAETGATGSDGQLAQSFQMIPGQKIAKKPNVTVTAGSVDCYVFVKLTESANFDTFLTYDMASGWTQLTEDKDRNAITDLIYYRKVSSSEMGTPIDVLADNQVTVLGSVTMADMEAAKIAAPSLTVQAFASQLANGAVEFSAAEAWANVSNPSGT